MRKKLPIAVLAILIAACSESPSNPTSDIDLAAAAADAVALGDRIGSAGPRELAQVHRLPDNLKLTSAQEAAIKLLVDDFVAATAADRAALMAILTQAHEAIKAGKSRAEVGAILAQALPIRVRLHAAEAALGTGILALLSAEQKAWLAANPPRGGPLPPRPSCPPLTPTQHTQINALLTAFHEANHADLAAIAAAERAAHQARRDGASAADVQKILDAVKPNRDRVAAARAVLETAIANVLTAEQKACRAIPAPRGR